MKEKKLSPAKIKILEALHSQSKSLGFNELQKLIKKPENKEKIISPKGLSDNLRKLESLRAIRNFDRKWQITPTGEEFLKRYKVIQSIEGEPYYYSNTLDLKMNLENLEPYPSVILRGINSYEHYPIPIPVEASFFASEHIKKWIDDARDAFVYADQLDEKKFSDLNLEEKVSPIKGYLNDIIISNCVQVGKEYEKYRNGQIKDKPKLDVSRALNFNLGVITIFEGKKIIEKMNKNRLTRKEIKKIKNRLVGLILLNILGYYESGCNYIIPTMIEGGLLNKNEGKMLQQLYEKIHGKMREDVSSELHTRDATIFERVFLSSDKEKEEAQTVFLIKALEYLKKGEALTTHKPALKIMKSDDFMKFLNLKFDEILEKIEKNEKLDFKKL